MNTPVKFENPPVVEVVFGVSFASMNLLKAAHVGAFWEKIKEKFPATEDAPPVPTVLEDGAQIFEWGPLPPLRRTLLISKDGRQLIQIQQDRFLFNWKRTLEDGNYPSYAVNIREFEENLTAFENFLSSAGLIAPAYRQFEMTYVNHINIGNGLNVIKPEMLLIDHVRATDAKRFLPAADGFTWETSYSLPKNSGRLHVTAQMATNAPESEKLMRLDLTARGISTDTSVSGRRPWFDLAHEWITKGFADVTSPVLQGDVWKRTL